MPSCADFDLQVVSGQKSSLTACPADKTAFVEADCAVVAELDMFVRAYAENGHDVCSFAACVKVVLKEAASEKPDGVLQWTELAAGECASCVQPAENEMTGTEI